MPLENFYEDWTKTMCIGAQKNSNTLRPMDKISCWYDLAYLHSRSAVQHLDNWHNLSDFTGMNTLRKLKNISQSHQIFLQWTLSQVDISGTEAAARFAKVVANETTVSPVSLIFSELFFTAKFKNKSDWLRRVQVRPRYLQCHLPF